MSSLPTPRRARLATAVAAGALLMAAATAPAALATDPPPPPPPPPSLPPSLPSLPAPPASAPAPTASHDDPPTPQPTTGDAAPPAAVPTAPAAPVTTDPPRRARVSAVHMRGLRLTLDVSCDASGTVSLASPRKRARPLSIGRFTCTAGRGTATLRLPKAFARGARKRVRLVATVSSDGRATTSPILLRSATGRWSASAHAATWDGSPSTECYGSGAGMGGTESVSLDESATFGGTYGETVWARAAIWAYIPGSGWSSPAISGWTSYTALRPWTDGAYWDPSTGTFVIGGTTAPGESFYLQWGGRNLLDIGSYRWTIAGIQAYTGSGGWKFDWVNTDASGSASKYGVYCWFA
jgi:hypothetical protein